MSYKHVKEWRNRTKQRLLAAFGSSCGLCLYNSCAQALEFHHLNPLEKDFTLARWRKVCAWSKLVTEVRKCVLLCANCHRAVHAGLLDPSAAPRFDEKYAEYREEKHVVFDNCSMCGSTKPDYKKYCSRSCAGKSIRLVDWDSIDLGAKLKETPNYEFIGRELGVTGTAVKKKSKKTRYPEVAQWLERRSDTTRLS